MMKRTCKRRQVNRGSSMIEVLVTLVILMLALLGLVGLMVQSQRSQMESYQRVQALLVVQDMANRINANRKAAGCYVVTTAVDGTPYLGTTTPPATALTPTCTVGTAAQQAMALQDLTDWSNLLLGTSEKSGTSNVGVMLGARGCVELVSVGVYRVSVVWQGNGKTAAPAGVGCAAGLYGDEAQRRAVAVPVKIANIS